MSLVIHVLIAMMYTVVASISATVLMSAPLVRNGYGMALGAAMLALCGLAHLSYVNWRRFRDLDEQLGRLRLASRVLFENVGDGVTPDDNHGPNSDKVERVVAEVKVLQKLIERLAVEPHPLPTTEPAGSAGNVATRLAGELPAAQMLGVLREALRLDRVDIYVQPIVRLPHRKVCYYECFSRIRDASGAVVMPDQFIALAEQEHLVSTVDNMQLFRCVQLIRQTQLRDKETAFFCNISRHSLVDGEFFESFVDFMAENKELAPAIVFEFNQTDFEELLVDRSRDLQRLAALGFRFSLDHVGELNVDAKRLSALGVRFIKIEAERLLGGRHGAGADIDRRDFKVMLTRRRIDLIAEKIEDERSLIELMEFGIDYGQGYLFGEPRPSRAD